MRFLLTLAALAAVTVSAFAQNGGPKEVDAITTIKLYAGETRIFTFDQSIAEIKSTGENVKIFPESDRTFAFQGLSPGAVILTVFNSDAKLVYRTRVVVAGGVVRIYGTSASDEKKSDYVGYVCTDIGCGRADPDIERQSPNTSITRTRRNARGDIITTTTARD